MQINPTGQTGLEHYDGHTTRPSLASSSAYEVNSLVKDPTFKYNWCQMHRDSLFDKLPVPTEVILCYVLTPQTGMGLDPVLQSAGEHAPILESYLTVELHQLRPACTGHQQM